MKLRIPQNIKAEEVIVEKPITDINDEYMPDIYYLILDEYGGEKCLNKKVLIKDRHH